MKEVALILIVCGVISVCFGATTIDCDVVIAGGTTAALASAIISAKEGAKTCLLEPTDWIGGQFSSSGVTAIDWAWHRVTDHNKTIDVAKASTDKRNQPFILSDIVSKSSMSTGKCWVSVNCFLPSAFLSAVSEHVDPLISSGTLLLFKETVVKNVIKSTTGTKINSLLAIQRKFKGDSSKQCNGYDVLLSKDLNDWYDPQESDRFSKEVFIFNGKTFIDATEWGEILVLSGAQYLQGIAEKFDGDISGEGGPDTCGQGIVYGFSETILSKPIEEPPNPYPDSRWDNYYDLLKYTWEKIFTYRRLVGESWLELKSGDITLQNWGRGNDNAKTYIFLSRVEAESTAKAGKWAGGVNTNVLYDSETIALGWHYWYKNKTTLGNKLILNKDIWGTCHGLTKVPYIRDTRRSVGINGFIMNVTQIIGSALKVVGEVFPDRIALGAYNCDIHSMDFCKYPDYMHESHPVLPFFIPLRALTNSKIENLLVAGKTIAQSFLVNAATRLHPTEWTTGTAAGVTAAFMSKMNITSTATICGNTNLVNQIQKVISKHAPLSWTVEEKLYPPSL